MKKTDIQLAILVPRFGGTGNTRVVKAIDDFDLKLCGCIDYNYPEEIATLICLGRRKSLLPFIEIPKALPRDSYSSYIRVNPELFKDCVTAEMRKAIFETLDDYES